MYRYSDIALKLPHVIEIVSRKDWIIYSDNIMDPRFKIKTVVKN
jgi:hypothetical protein